MRSDGKNVYVHKGLRFMDDQTVRKYKKLFLLIEI